MNYLGTLYGVGAGPGATNLLTLRALEVLREVAVLALPRGSDFGESMALRIVKPVLEPRADQERLLLTFPMSKDPERVRPAVLRACSQIEARLREGKSVAFVSEGDASTFSTFLYVRRELRARIPELPVEVVPGVSSIMAVPAALGIGLADGQERVAILSGTSGFDDLAEVLARFDTVVLMKVGPELPHIIETLRKLSLLERAAYVSRATMEEQRIVRDLTQVQDQRGDCFAMIVVSRNERKGVLMGDVPSTPRPAAVEEAP
ncbi:MAG: precorrin-2 C(20)-methyltransferase [Myxococcales bacterium]